MNLIPHLCVLVNAFFWGLCWIPLLDFTRLGLHPLGITLLSYGLLAGLLLLFEKRSILFFFRSKPLVFLGISYGLTNVFFNWAITEGEIVRVVFLFYLMPIWSAIFAKILLNESLGILGLCRISFALLGIFLLVVAEEFHKNGLSGFSLSIMASDFFAMLGGIFFGLGNVFLRMLKTENSIFRTFSIFFGSFLVSAVILALIWLVDPSVFFGKIYPFHLGYFSLNLTYSLIVFSIVLGIANFCLQYGGSKLMVQTTSMLMLMEIVVATISTTYYGENTLTYVGFLGGLIVVMASSFSIFYKGFKSS